MGCRCIAIQVYSTQHIQERLKNTHALWIMFLHSHVSAIVIASTYTNQLNDALHTSAIIRPMQYSLALFSMTIRIPHPAILFNLHDVTPHRLPSFDLTRIIWRTSAHIIPAIPLKPPARIILPNPTFLSPNRKRLTGIETKIIKLRIMYKDILLLKLRVDKPSFRKLLCAITHIDAAKNSKCQHLLWGKLGTKVWMKASPRLRNAHISIPLLHCIVDHHNPLFLRRWHTQLALNKIHNE